MKVIVNKLYVRCWELTYGSLSWNFSFEELIFRKKIFLQNVLIRWKNKVTDTSCVSEVIFLTG